jgi:hypothetical protein
LAAFLGRQSSSRKLLTLALASLLCSLDREQGNWKFQMIRMDENENRLIYRNSKAGTVILQSN